MLQIITRGVIHPPPGGGYPPSRPTSQGGPSRLGGVSKGHPPGPPKSPIQALGRVKQWGGPSPFLVTPTVSSRGMNEIEGAYTPSNTPTLACTICEGETVDLVPAPHRHPGTSAARACAETDVPLRQSFWRHPGPGEGWLHGEGQRPTPSPWSRFRPIQGGGYLLPWADFGPSNWEGRHSPITPQYPPVKVFTADLPKLRP